MLVTFHHVYTHLLQFLQFGSRALQGQLRLAIKLLDDVTQDYGLSGINIIKNIHREMYDLEILEEKKIELAEFEYRLSQGATEEIQLKALLAKIALLEDFK